MSGPLLDALSDDEPIRVPLHVKNIIKIENNGHAHSLATHFGDGASIPTFASVSAVNSQTEKNPRVSI